MACFGLPGLRYRTDRMPGGLVSQTEPMRCAGNLPAPMGGWVGKERVHTMAKLASRAMDVYRRAVAFHEAGHAVVSVCERMPVVRVTIVPDGDTDGVCVGRPWPASRSPEFFNDSRTKTRLRKQIRVLFAGPIAEARSQGTKDWDLDENSWDAQSIAECALEHSHDRATELCAAEQRHAEVLVTEHWAAIAAVAEALLNRGILSGRRVRELVKRSAACGRLGIDGAGIGEHHRS